MKHSYVRKIPKGYRYCKMCDLITPHENKCCVICDYTLDGMDGYVCDNCGWEHDPIDLEPETIKLSTDNCEVDCYTYQQNIFNYQENYSANFDCYDAKNWSYEIMCPICNDILEIEDGNC